MTQPDPQGTPTPAPRAAGLAAVARWFAPALQPGEQLQAALAATPYPLTVMNSLVATARELVGQNQGRVLLLTDRSFHIVGRRFWRRRFRVLYRTLAVGSVPVRAEAGRLSIGDETFYLNPTGFQLKGSVGSAVDVQLFVAAGAH